MEDRKLERLLRERRHLVPAADPAANRALATLGLNEGQPIPRSPLTWLVATAPAVLACFVVFLVQGETIRAGGAHLVGAIPEVMRLVTDSWQEAAGRLDPGFLTMLGATTVMLSLFASWTLGSAFTRRPTRQR